MYIQVYILQENLSKWTVELRVLVWLVAVTAPLARTSGTHNMCEYVKVYLRDGMERYVPYHTFLRVY